MKEAMNIVSTVGFPIACCLFLGWYCKYMFDKMMAFVSQMETKYGDLVKEGHAVVENNTAALIKLSERIVALERGGNEQS